MALATPPTEFPRAIHRERRLALVARLRALRPDGMAPAPRLGIFAGVAPARNYPANLHPYRASSHFLHFVGFPIEGAILVVDPTSDDESAGATLHVPSPAADDIVWHGPSPRLEELGERLGLAVRTLDALAADTARPTLYLPSFDPSTRGSQHATFGAPPTRADHEALAEILVALRIRADAHAIAEHERAANITARAHRAGMAFTRPGRRACEVRAVMEAVFTAHAMTPAYPSIVTPRGCILHAGPSDESLDARAMLLADVGAETARGYAADVTRSYPVGGRFDSRQRAVYDAVARAQETAITCATVGTRYRHVHETAMRSIARSLVELGILHGDAEERAFDGSTALFFPHGVGHLLGLDVHDMEDLGDRAGYALGRTRSDEPGIRYLRLDRDLAADMLVTIEPGIYFVPALLDDAATRTAFAGRVDWATVDVFRGVSGVRIEDDVRIAETGPVVLTASAPKHPEALESLVGSGVDWDDAFARL